MDRVETRGSPPIREHYSLWRGVRVTSVAFVVGDRTYEIRELRRLRVQRGSMQPPLRAALGVLLAQAAAVGAALVAVGYAGGASPAVYVLGVAHAMASTILVVASLVRWPTPTELWAEYRGRPTLLYSCPDEVEFGKVRRAIGRAMIAQRMIK